MSHFFLCGTVLQRLTRTPERGPYILNKWRDHKSRDRLASDHPRPVTLTGGFAPIPTAEQTHITFVDCGRSWIEQVTGPAGLRGGGLGGMACREFPQSPLSPPANRRSGNGYPPLCDAPGNLTCCHAETGRGLNAACPGIAVRRETRPDGNAWNITRKWVTPDRRMTLSATRASRQVPQSRLCPQSPQATGSAGVPSRSVMA